MNRLERGVLLLMALAMSACSFMEHAHCVDTSVVSLVSPDGNYRATAFHRTCGGGGSGYTWVRLETVSALSTLSGGEQEMVADVRGKYPIKLTWKSPSELEINTSAFRQSSSTSVRMQQWKGVSLIYKEE
jgi:hypothetical protein